MVHIMQKHQHIQPHNQIFAFATFLHIWFCCLNHHMFVTLYNMYLFWGTHMRGVLHIMTLTGL